MAWLIHDHVIRGEIDNRLKGRVSGKLWLDGAARPVTLDLTGNACPDLAGCLLKFKNSGQTFPIVKTPRFDPLQRGRIGTLSASRKVRVYTVPEAQAFELLNRGEKPPERMANALFLEWYSESNGRVVIESADFAVTISTPEWRLSPAEEKQRAKEAEAGWRDFVMKLDLALAKQKRGQKPPEADWDEHDYEKLMRESDARTDKYIELLEKYGHSDEAQERIAKEMGWDQDEGSQEPSLGAEEESEHEGMSVDEMNRISAEAEAEPPPQPDAHREGIDWIRTKDGSIRHPLQHRCFESAMRVWHECESLGIKKSEDDDLHQFIFEFQTTGVKLAGALCGFAQGRGYRDNAFTVAYLKRALDHLHQSQKGLEAVAKKKLLPQKRVAAARKELFEIREGILMLMDDFRGRN